MATACSHARWLEKCYSLIGSGTSAWLYIWGAHGQDFIRFQISSHSAALAVFACRISGVYTEFQLIADDDILLDLDISRIIIYG